MQKPVLYEEASGQALWSSRAVGWDVQNSQYPHQHAQQTKVLHLEVPFHSLRPHFLRII